MRKSIRNGGVETCGPEALAKGPHTDGHRSPSKVPMDRWPDITQPSHCALAVLGQEAEACMKMATD